MRMAFYIFPKFRTLEKFFTLPMLVKENGVSIRICHHNASRPCAVPVDWFTDDNAPVDQILLDGADIIRFFKVLRFRPTPD